MNNTLLSTDFTNKAYKKLILTQTPFRITLGGGGTDVIWYSSIKGGSWISAAINYYVYIFIKRVYDSKFIKTFDGKLFSIVDDYKKVQNPIIRECLKLAKIRSGIEIVSISDVSSKSGLGGSGAFEVGLLNGLHKYKNESVSKLQLASEACEIEIKRLKYPVGPQDQYITAVGGINYFEVDTRGNMHIEPLYLSYDVVTKLQENLLYFRTGIQKDTVLVLGSEKEKIKSKSKKSDEIIQSLDEIKDLGQQVKKYLLTGKVDEVGSSFHTHWLIKKRLSSKVSNPQIDYWYEQGMRNGALGGKIMGAGGGGWFVFYVNKNKKRFSEQMTKLGLNEQSVKFDWEGTKTLINFN